MFQMNANLFNQCWPLIAAQIERGQQADHALEDEATTPSPAIVEEAGYVLGIAMGYSMSAGAATSAAGQTRHLGCRPTGERLVWIDVAADHLDTATNDHKFGPEGIRQYVSESRESGQHKPPEVRLAAEQVLVLAEWRKLADRYHPAAPHRSRRISGGVGRPRRRVAL